MSVPSKELTEEFLRYLLGWKGDTPTRMLLSAPIERQDFFLWKRNRITGEVMMRQLDMFEQLK